MQTETQTSGATASSLERRIDLSVALAEIDKDVEQRLKQLSKTAKMPGFRPGKVPMKMVAQQYSGQARSEAIGGAVERVFGEKVREQNLRVAGYPRIEPRAASSEAVLEFTAVFEVYPEVALGDLSGQKVEKATLTVGEAEIDKTVEVLRKQRTTFSTAARKSEKGDRLVIDFTGRKDGEEFEGGKAVDYPVFVGGGMMLPDFEAALEGVSAGETKTFDVKFPDDYHAKDLAGQQVQFTVTVKSVEAPILPELNDDFARALGIKDGSVANLRTEVKSNLSREVKKRLQALTKNQVMDALLAANPIDVPKALVEIESRQMAENAIQDLQRRGMAANNVPVEPSWFAEQAERRVKLGLILAEVVSANALQAKPDQVRAVVDEFAETFEDPQEVVRWYYSQPQRLAEAEALVMENNVVEWVLSKTQVSEKTVDFDELMGNAA